MNDAIDTALAQHEYKAAELAKQFNKNLAIWKILFTI